MQTPLKLCKILLINSFQRKSRGLGSWKGELCTQLNSRCCRLTRFSVSVTTTTIYEHTLPTFRSISPKVKPLRRGTNMMQCAGAPLALRIPYQAAVLGNAHSCCMQVMAAALLRLQPTIIISAVRRQPPPETIAAAVYTVYRTAGQCNVHDNARLDPRWLRGFK